MNATCRLRWLWGDAGKAGKPAGRPNAASRPAPQRRLHPAVWKEVEAIARTVREKFQIDLRPAIEYMGLQGFLEQVGVARVIETVGLDRFIAEAGDKEVIKRIGVDRFLAGLSPAERRELKRRLQ